jgi:iron complex transport system permease protein
LLCAEGGLKVLNGSKRSRGGNEYVFIDGRAMRQDEVVRIDLGATAAPGQAEAERAEKRKHPQGAKDVTAEGVTGKVAAAAKPDGRTSDTFDTTKSSTQDTRKSKRRTRAALDAMEASDAFEFAPGAQGEITMAGTEKLMREDRRILRLKCAAFGAAIVVCALVALCVDSTRPGNYFSPLEVVQSIGAWFSLLPARIFSPESYSRAFIEVSAAVPNYAAVMVQAWTVVKYGLCGILLALSGMLYQNTFRNPIAAPSMLGVSNGINIAILVLVLQFGVYAVNYSDLYYLYATIGGIGVLVLVLLGGKWISGKGRFNVVNMILMGTIMSQLLGVIMTYAQTYLMDEAQWVVYYQLQNATGAVSVWMYITLFVGGLAALVPVILFRFKLNLISFSDDETRLLGVDPTRLRVLALVCGSVMILVAQMNAGQVAMASLIIPFVVRATFGSEFSKQLVGNMLVGALVLLICGFLGQVLLFEGEAVGVSSVVNIVAIPLFVWMMAIRQRSWE